MNEFTDVDNDIDKEIEKFTKREVDKAHTR